MNFTNKDIMDLRAKTGVGMMDCKKALIEADGDMDKAVDILREKGMATSAKRAGKIASQGIVDAYGKDGVYALVEVNCESDFVAKGDQFKAFVREIASYIVDAAPASVEDVAAAKADLLNETVAKIGEKIVVRRFERYVAADGAAVSSYIHMGGKIGVMVETVGASDEVAHDVALQIAAANPDYVTIAEVPADRVEKEKEILKVQALNEDKPKPMNIIEKMIEGRIHKFYKAKQTGEPVCVWGSGKPLRQFIYNVDMGELIVWVLREYEEIAPIILSVGEDEEVSIGDVVNYIADAIDYHNIEYDHFVRYGQVDKDRLDEIVSIILETVCSKRKTIRIAGDDYPAELVKAKFMKLNSSHIEFVFDCMKENTTKIRNIKQYLKAVLFNAPNTIDSYYTALVNHDMYGGTIQSARKKGIPDYSYCSGILKL